MTHYKYLTAIDLSNNRLFGQQAGTAIANLLKRDKISKNQGVSLKTISVANNKLENQGFELIVKALWSDELTIRSLDLTNCGISKFQGVIVKPSADLKDYNKLRTLILDNN